MTKLLFAKVIGGFYLSSSLFMGGAGGYLLFNEVKIIKTIEKRNINDEGRIIKTLKSNGTWTDIKEYSKSQFTQICTGTGPKGAPQCNRYLKANNVTRDKEQIFLYIGYPTQTINWGALYKFTYESEIDGNREFQGECDNSSGNVEEPKNPCATKNLPKGWKKEYLMTFSELVQKLNQNN